MVMGSDVQIFRVNVYIHVATDGGVVPLTHILLNNLISHTHF